MPKVYLIVCGEHTHVSCERPHKVVQLSIEDLQQLSYRQMNERAAYINEQIGEAAQYASTLRKLENLS